jgi:adenosylcobinamide-GDP ribazoletransferase
MVRLGTEVVQLLQRGLAAITFYTCLPLPTSGPIRFQGISTFAPLVGVLIGLGLWGADWGLAALGLPIASRSALVVALWLGVTGGLHLDGAMDAADGLAVMDRQKRLAVMADSHSGAFGVMVAIAILGLKTLALMEIAPEDGMGRGLVLMAAAGWGRWGQVAAIGFYPYLRPEGKGAFHKRDIRLPWALLPGGIVLVGLAALSGWSGGILAGAGAAIALVSGYWFHRQLGGHTGDTYGAVVEWTEALMLCVATAL